MLSKKERDYLDDNNTVPKCYQYVLEHRIKKKIREFVLLELPLIEQSQSLTEF